MPAAHDKMPGAPQEGIHLADGRPILLAFEDPEALILLPAELVEEPRDSRLSVRILPLKAILMGLAVLVVTGGAAMCLTAIVPTYQKEPAQLGQLDSEHRIMMMLLEEGNEKEEVKAVSRNPSMRRVADEDQGRSFAERIVAEFAVKEGEPHMQGEAQSDEHVQQWREDQVGIYGQPAETSSRTGLKQASEGNGRVDDDAFEKLISGLPDRRRLRSRA